MRPGPAPAVQPRKGSEIIATQLDDPLAAYIDAAIALERLPVSPEWRPAVAAHLAAIREAAGLVLAYPLDDLTEAAPIFEP